MPALANSTHESMCRDVAGGMSREAAWRAHGFGSRNSTRFFNRPKIAARVAELQSEFNEGAKIHAAYLAEKLLTVVNTDVCQFIEPVPYSTRLRLRDITKLPAEQRRAISELVIDKNGRTSIKLESKTHALDSLAKMTGCVGPSTIVNVNASAEARAAADVAQMSAPELARRISLIIEDAANAGESIDDAQAVPIAPDMFARVESNPLDTATAIPPRERARQLVSSMFAEVDKLLDADPDVADYLAEKFTEAVKIIRDDTEEDEE